MSFPLLGLLSQLLLIAIVHASSSAKIDEKLLSGHDHFFAVSFVLII